MSVTKLQREKKRQLGQFLTPPSLAAEIVKTLPLTKESKILEPSMGDGSFIIPLIERFLPLHAGTTRSRLTVVLNNNIWGVELDSELHRRCLERIKARWGFLPTRHHLIQGDFFRHVVSGTKSAPCFDVVVGNPPFGGTFDPAIEDDLDAVYGTRDGAKIKKETYAFLS